MVENSTRLTSTDEHSSRETHERQGAWLCELTLQETAIEPTSPSAASASSPPHESASQAVADAVGGAQLSADSGPTSAAACPVKTPRSLHVRASGQEFPRGAVLDLGVP
jgi:hypothetical protein